MVFAPLADKGISGRGFTWGCKELKGQGTMLALQVVAGFAQQTSLNSGLALRNISMLWQSLGPVV